MAGIKQILSRTFFWSYERGTWQYDVAVVLILMFVLLTRREWFRDQPQVGPPVASEQIQLVLVSDDGHRQEYQVDARILAPPERIGVDAEVIQRTLDGRLKISPDGTMRESGRYLLVGREGAARPDPVQAAWLYAQMVRWGQATISPEAVRIAKAVFRPDLYEAALGHDGRATDASGAIGAFAGPAFDPNDIAGHLAAFKIGRRKS